ncbi:pinin [Cebidichthys violaceus]|uniref:pinin n=1 Tax=Cebidichthys violaceus TaxID=271503 RepID=UPI0035CAAE21
MDVSIAVTLIRGQMGAVVERAVNGAVETVLAEMLKVVGVKFEELKSQVALMKRDIASLQREKVQKEKENDNIRAKLRYTELKLKYYRQGVEEELQQRASASALVRIHPSTFLQAQRDGAGVSSTEASSLRSPQTRNSSNQECTSTYSASRHSIRVRGVSDVGVVSCDTSDLLLPVSLSVNTPTESLDSSAVLFCPAERDTAQSKDEEDDCEWTVSLPPHTEGVDAASAPPVRTLSLDPGQQSAAGSRSTDGSTQADSSTLLHSAAQVKQEAQEEQQQQQQQEEEEEVICIKEEPEEVQEVMATLLLDCQMQQGHLPESEAQRSVTECLGLPASQRSHTAAFSSAGPDAYLMPQPVASLQSMVALPSGVPPHQAVRPWTKDLSLYEEYKLRRNELRRRSINRRRELEKTLPQPLLANLVRERREKTRLRVARWRAKRKLQACINQDHALGGTAALSQAGFPIGSQHQQLRVTCAAASSSQQRAQSNSFLNNSLSAALPFIPSSSSSSSLFLRGHNMAPHQHTVTSSSSSYPQVSLLQQSVSLTDADILQ